MIDFDVYGLFTIVFFVFLFFVFAKSCIDVIAEPIALITITLAFSMSFIWVVYGYSHYSLIVFFQLFLFFSFLRCGDLFARKFFKIRKTDNSIPVNKNSIIGLPFLTFFSWLAFFIIIILNAIHIYQSGSALLSGNIDEAKTMGFSGGSGIIRRINWSLLYFDFFCFALLYRLTKHIGNVVAMAILTLLLISLGSKGALISVLVMFSVLFASKSFFSGDRKRLNFKVFIYGGAGLLFSMFIFIISSDNFFEALSKFYTRLMYFGDVNLYLNNDYVSQQFSHFDFFNFIDFALNPLTSMFRLTDYYLPVGVQFVHALNEGRISIDGNYGPNLTFYATAILFFGWLGGGVFSSIVGFYVGFIRRVCITITITKPFRFLFYCYSYFLCLTLVTDPLMFIGIIYDSLFFVLGTIVFSKILWLLLKNRNIAG